MTTSICPEHGTTVRDLALGRLDDGAAQSAEEIRCSCPACRSWWNKEIEVPARQIEPVVAEVFAGFRVPRRSRLPHLLPLAAAVLLMVAGLALWNAGSSGVKAPESIPVQAASAQAVDLPSPEASTVIFRDDLESGSLASWVIHTGHDSGTAAPVADPQVIFADGLESGSSALWSSS